MVEKKIKHISPMSIQCNPCFHTDNITIGLSNVCSDSGESLNEKHNIIALDCEMVGVGPTLESALARISIVNYFGDVLYDVMVRPEKEITDYRTRWSGVRPSDMRRAIPFECVQDQVKRILHNRLVIGHMIKNDFSVLGFNHPHHLIRDTGRSSYPKLAGGLSAKHPVSLRKLALSLLHVRIQDYEHCSIEDARTAMAIYRLVENAWESGLVMSNRKNKKPQKSYSKPNDSVPKNSLCTNLVVNREWPLNCSDSFIMKSDSLKSKTLGLLDDDSFWSEYETAGLF